MKEKMADSDFPLSADQCFIFSAFCMPFDKEVTERIRVCDALKDLVVRVTGYGSQPYLCFLYIAMDNGIDTAVSAADSRGMPS